MLWDFWKWNWPGWALNVIVLSFWQVTTFFFTLKAIVVGGTWLFLDWTACEGQWTSPECGRCARLYPYGIIFTDSEKKPHSKTGYAILSKQIPSVLLLCFYKPIMLPKEGAKFPSGTICFALWSFFALWYEQLYPWNTLEYPAIGRNWQCLHFPNSDISENNCPWCVVFHRHPHTFGKQTIGGILKRLTWLFTSTCRRIHRLWLTTYRNTPYLWECQKRTSSRKFAPRNSVLERWSNLTVNRFFAEAVPTTQQKTAMYTFHIVAIIPESGCCH